MENRLHISLYTLFEVQLSGEIRGLTLLFMEQGMAADGRLTHIMTEHDWLVILIWD